MDDITKQLSKYTIEEDVLLAEANYNPRNAARVFKDVWLVLQEIHDLKSKRVPEYEKKEILDKNIEALNYLLRKQPMADVTKEALVAVVLVFIKHAGFREKDIDLKY